MLTPLESHKYTASSNRTDGSMVAACLNYDRGQGVVCGKVIRFIFRGLAWKEANQPSSLGCSWSRSRLIEITAASNSVCSRPGLNKDQRRNGLLVTWAEGGTVNVLKISACESVSVRVRYPCLFLMSALCRRDDSSFVDGEHFRAGQYWRFVCTLRNRMRFGNIFLLARLMQ